MSGRNVVVIGAGPGGYSAALRAASLGSKVYLIEKAEIGGTCVNRGCIPTKSLLKSAEVSRLLRSSSKYGVKASGTTDISAVRARAESVVTRLREHMKETLSEAGVKLVEGEGFVHSPGKASVRECSSLLQWDSLVVATGSSPRFPAVPGLSGEGVVSGEEALFFESVPARVVVLGGGAIGLEVSTLYSSLGSEVFLVEVEPRLLPNFDEDVSRAAGAGMQSLGVKVFTGQSVKEVLHPGGSVVAVLSGGSFIEAGLLVVAAGRKPNTEALGLEALGLKVGPSGFIPVDPPPKTGIPNVYAVGDVTGRHLLAHAAMAEGQAAGSLASGLEVRHDDRFVPKCVYSVPEIASVGLAEDKARSLGYDVLVGVSPFSLNALSACHDSYEGFVKVVAERRYGEILGVHIVGAHAADLIVDAVTAMTLESTVKEWASVIRPHPGYSETVGAALSAILRQLED